MRIPDGVRRAFRLPPSHAALSRELDDEIAFHIETRVRELIRGGLSESDARAEAVRRFGDAEDLRRYCETMGEQRMKRLGFFEGLSTLGGDLRFALRQIRKAPGFAAVTVLTLALGVGATTAIFTVVNGVILEPLPFVEPEKIVHLWGIDGKGDRLAFADPTFDAVVAENRSFAAIAEFRAGAMSIVRNGEPVRARTVYGSHDYFDVLGVKPAAGRFFIDDEERPGGPLAIVISDRFWERHFARSRAAIGSTISTSGVVFTVVGVLPPNKEFPAETDVVIPRAIRAKNTSYTAHNWNVIARLRPEVTIASARSDLSRVLRTVAARVGQDTWTKDGTVVGLREQIVGPISSLLLLVFGASTVLLIIACANVANLMIARMATRESEVAVRMALGAGKRRLAQQLLLESAVLAAIGCLGGVLLAVIGTRLLVRLKPVSIPRVGEVTVDWKVLGFAVAVSAVTALSLGLLAAWRGARGDLRAALARGQRSHGAGGTGYRLRGALVVVQLAMTVILLIGAGLLSRSMYRLLHVETGFRTSGVVVAGASFESPPGVDRTTARSQYADALLERARAIPGVTSVGVADAPPFSGGSSNGNFGILPNASVKLDQASLEAYFKNKETTGWATYRLASAGYFQTLGIPLRAGRMFDDRDRAGAPHVAVISASLADTRWPAGDAIGKVIEFGNIDGDLTPITIVGIVGDVREQDLTQPPDPAVYVSYRQRPGNGGAINVVMATANEPRTMLVARDRLREVRADVPIGFQTIEEIVGRTLATRRFILLVVGAFGAIALVLAALGIYGVIAFLVAQRGREISIRVALGARAGDIFGMILREGFVLALAGAVVGAAGAVAATRLLTSLLYEIKPTDPVSFLGVGVFLCAIALVASFVPARRASRIPAMDVLRGG